MPTAKVVARQIDLQGTVCVEPCEQTDTRLSRSEIVLGIIEPLLVEAESVIDLLKPLLGG